MSLFIYLYFILGVVFFLSSELALSLVIFYSWLVSILFLYFEGLKLVLLKRFKTIIITRQSRKRSSYEFANAIGIDIKSISFACIEASSIEHIFTTFKGEEIIEQYKIDNYIIDLYFPKYKLAIECDEKGHNILTNKLKDVIREKTII
jgi:hypothetical protein